MVADWSHLDPVCVRGTATRRAGVMKAIKAISWQFRLLPPLWSFGSSAWIKKARGAERRNHSTNSAIKSNATSNAQFLLSSVILILLALSENDFQAHEYCEVKPVNKFLQTRGPGKLRHRPNPLLPSLSQTLPTPLRHCATENGGDLAQSKRFPGTNTQSRSPRIMGNRRASTCDPAPKDLEFRATPGT